MKIYDDGAVDSVVADLDDSQLDGRKSAHYIKVGHLTAKDHSHYLGLYKARTEVSTMHSKLADSPPTYV